MLIVFNDKKIDNFMDIIDKIIMMRLSIMRGIISVLVNVK